MEWDEEMAANIQLSACLHKDLLSAMPIEQVFQKHVIDGTSFFFREFLSSIDMEYELRYALASAIGISINDVVIVGSAKMGFSVKTDMFVEFDGKFNVNKNPRDKSDIDIAIVNRANFDSTIEEIFHLSRHFEKNWIDENWRINAFYKTPTDLHKQYALYLARGWLRPDFFPNMYFQNSPWKAAVDCWYRRLGGRKIALAFYSDWKYLKHYQMKSLDGLRSQFINLGA